MKTAFVFTVVILSLYGSNAKPADTDVSADSKEDPNERMLHMFKKASPPRKQFLRYPSVPQIPSYDPYYSPCGMNPMAYMAPQISPMGPLGYGDFGFGAKNYGFGPSSYGYNLPKFAAKLPKKYYFNNGYGGFDSPYGSPMFRSNPDEFATEPEQQ